jgi:predicted GNAT family acetyltransferase
MSETEYEFEHDLERQTFGLKVKKDWVELEYRANREGKFFITNLEGPPELLENGLGDKMLEHALHYIKENDYRLIPSCKAIKDYLKRYPEYKELVATGIRVG